MTIEKKERMKILIAEDHKIIFNGYKNILDNNGVYDITHAYNGQEVVDWLKTNTADILLLDISMPIMDGIEVLKYFNLNNIEQKVIIVSDYSTPQFIKQTFKNGANGFVCKQEVTTCLLDSLQAVFKGKIYISKNVENNIRKYEISSADLKKEPCLLNTLSDKEQEMLGMYIQNKTYKEIENELEVAASTVKTNFQRIRDKLNVKTNIGIINYAFRYLKVK